MCLKMYAYIFYKLNLTSIQVLQHQPPVEKVVVVVEETVIVTIVTETGPVTEEVMTMTGHTANAGHPRAAGQGHHVEGHGRHQEQLEVHLGAEGHPEWSLDTQFRSPNCH